MSEADVTIIGGGPAGYVAAIKAAHLGLKTILVEKDRLGGVCLNRGCIPTKTLVSTAELFNHIKRASEYGIEVNNPVLNFAKTMDRKDKVVQRLTKGVETLMQANQIEVIKGEGTITHPGEVRVNGDHVDEKVKTKNILISTGSSVSRIPIPGLDLDGIMTSDEALALKNLPEKIIIIGGGIVGIEWAGIFNAFGVKVVVVEILPRILLSMDEEIVRRCLLNLKRKGIKVYTNSKIEKIEKKDNQLEVFVSTSDGQVRMTTDKVLLSSGRKPDFGNICVDKLGIEIEKQAIRVNRKMKTNISGIYAAGDVVGNLMLAHVASAEGKTAIENITGKEVEIDYRNVPKCVFSMPEIAGVGLNEDKAKDKFSHIKISRFPYMASGKALGMGETEGMVKIIAKKKDNRILGVHIFGVHASDLIAEATLGLNLNVTAEEIMNAIHAHPTLSEMMAEAAEGIVNKSTHMVR